jgi:hypothetical protein
MYKHCDRMGEFPNIILPTQKSVLPLPFINLSRATAILHYV